MKLINVLLLICTVIVCVSSQGVSNTTERETLPTTSPSPVTSASAPETTQVETSSVSPVTTTSRRPTVIIVTRPTASATIVSTVSTSISPSATSTATAQKSSQSQSKDDSQSTRVAIGLGIAGGLLVLAGLGIWIFKNQTGQSEQFKNRLNRDGTPPPITYESSNHSGGSQELERQKPYVGFEDFEYSSHAQPKKQYAQF